MEKQDARKEMKKVVIRFAVIFLVVLMVLTFFSKTVNQMLLPRVTTYIPSNKVLNSTYQFKGMVSYNNKKHAYPLFDYFIEDWLIREGTELEIGKPIAKLREADVEKRKGQFEIQVLLLEDRIAGLENSLEHDLYKSQRQSMERQLKAAQIEYDSVIANRDAFINSIDEEYNLLSHVEGKVRSIPMDDHRIIPTTMPLFEYLDDSSYPVLEWYMHPSKIATFDTGCKIRLDYTYLLKNGDISFEKTDSIFVDVDKVAYDEESEGYIYTVFLPRSNKNLVSSNSIEVSMIAKGRQLYNAIPKSALYGENMFYILITDPETGELRVKEVSANVMRKTDTHVQLNYNFSQSDRVIISTTKPLTHNAKVKLR